MKTACAAAFVTAWKLSTWVFLKVIAEMCKLGEANIIFFLTVREIKLLKITKIKLNYFNAIYFSN